MKPPPAGDADLKAQSASLTLYHFADWHHREVCLWRDQDHKPEVVATTPGIFISQRWVATTDLVAARSTSTLPHNGGECVNLSASGSVHDHAAVNDYILDQCFTLAVSNNPVGWITSSKFHGLVPTLHQGFLWHKAWLDP